MKKILGICLIFVLLLAMTACVRRMAPFSPHRSNSEAHQTAQTNEACLSCHDLAELGQSHQPGDDCLRCHRILQGD